MSCEEHALNILPDKNVRSEPSDSFNGIADKSAFPPLQSLAFSGDAKILARASESDNVWTERDCKGEKATLSDMQSKPLGVSDLTFLYGRTLREYSSQDIARIFGALSKRLPTLAVIDLNGNCLIRHGFYPKIGSECTLSDVLQRNVPQTYFLSRRRVECMVRSGVMNPLLVQAEL